MYITFKEREREPSSMFDICAKFAMRTYFATGQSSYLKGANPPHPQFFLAEDTKLINRQSSQKMIFRTAFCVTKLTG
jgi:hypothetical protein